MAVVKTAKTNRCLSSFLRFIGILLIIVHSRDRYIPSMANRGLLTKDVFDMGTISFILLPNYDWR
jgi:hypothetical protein